MVTLIAIILLLIFIPFSAGAATVTLLPSAENLCSAYPYFSLMSEVTNDGSLSDNIVYRYEFSPDGTTWQQLGQVKTHTTYSQHTYTFHTGWYRVTVAEPANINNPALCITSEPIYLQEVEGHCPTNIPMPADIKAQDVCEQGTLIFREDFGGNNPSDPITRQEPLASMSSRYWQVKNIWSVVSSGEYVIAKHGFKNNYESTLDRNIGSQWFVQDDHTYPNDYSRGYLLEVDGIGGDDAFYSTTIPVCHELDLSFFAYVANVLESHYNAARPKVRFVITDEETGERIWEESSGPIAPSTMQRYNNAHGWTGTMTQSAAWHLVGSTFHVPADVSVVRLSIYNDESSWNGNDFAMDDIEIRLCNPIVTITSGHEICQNEEYTFTTTVEGNNPFAQPYAYRWEYATDSLPFNSPDWQIVATTKDLHFEQIKLAQTGWYRFGISDEGNIDNRACRAMSAPFFLRVIDCTPPTLPDLAIISSSVTCMDSTYCFIVDTLNKSDLNDASHASTFNYLWEYAPNGIDWTEVSNTQDYCFTATKNKHGYYRLVITYKDQWNDIRHEYEPFYLQIRDCTPPPLPDAFISSEETTCLDSAYCFAVTIKNADAIADTIVLTYHWEFSHNGGAWGDLSAEKDFCLDAVTNDNACWYRVTIGFLNEQWQSTSTTYPFQLTVEDCTPPLPQIEIIGENEVCKDSAYCFTIKCINNINLSNPLYAYKWQVSTNGVSWSNYHNGKDLCISTVRKTYWYRIVASYNTTNEQTTVSEPFLLSLKDCEPDEPIDPIDPVDPEDPKEPEPGPYPDPEPEPLPEWPENRLYDLIVNKYDWLIVCDNTLFAKHFPNNKATAYHWYKNGQLIPNAIEDDYSESQELNGSFQLHITLDNNKLVHSNILYIKAATPEDELIAIYNYMGASIDIHTDLSTLPAGIYIFVYQSGNQARTEQVYIP